jgi:hypothetical protein
MLHRFLVIVAIVCVCLTIATPTVQAQPFVRQDSVAVAPVDTLSLFGKISDWASSNWVRPGTTKLERIGYVIGASLVFSLFDYVVFHKVVFAESNTDHSVPFSYRLAQSGVQTALSYLLYKQVGLSSTVAFNTIWWTWGDDIAFYGWLNLVNAGAPWYNRSFNGLQGNQVTWAGWTPIGLLRKQKTVISKDALFAQAAIGFSIALIIN